MFNADIITIKNTQCIAANIILALTKASKPLTICSNIPFRAWNCYVGFQKKEYSRIVFDILACVVLISPLGRSAAIAVDIFSEIFHLKSRTIDVISAILSLIKKDGNILPKLQLEDIDCAIYQNALKVLGFSENEAPNPTTVAERYRKISEEYTKRINLLADTNPIKKFFQKILEKVNIAYDTVKKKYEQDRNNHAFPDSPFERRNINPEDLD